MGFNEELFSITMESHLLHRPITANTHTTEITKEML